MSMILIICLAVSAVRAFVAIEDAAIARREEAYWRDHP